MKTFLIKIVCVAILSVMGIAVTFLGLLQIKDPRVAQIKMRFAIDAIYIMRETHEPKIVVISGSNGQFGVCSPLLRDSLGEFPVINAGVNMGFGLHLMLELYQPELHQGDIVLLMPEWEQYTHYYNGSSKVIRLLSSIYPQGYLLLDAHQWLYLQQYIPIHFKDVLLKGNTKVDPTGFSSIHSLNKFGDVIFHRPQSIYHYSWTLNTPLDARPFALISHFIHDCRQKGIHVLLLPPAYQQSSYDKSQCKIHDIVTRLEAQGTPLVASPERYTFPDSLSYDTPYHLTSEGAILRTRLLIEDIKKQLPDL